jgi:hypothetical protein
MSHQTAMVASNPSSSCFQSANEATASTTVVNSIFFISFGIFIITKLRRPVASIGRKVCLVKVQFGFLVLRLWFLAVGYS